MNLPVYIAEYAKRDTEGRRNITIDFQLKAGHCRKGAYIYALGAGAGSELVGTAVALAYRRGEYREMLGENAANAELQRRDEVVRMRNQVGRAYLQWEWWKIRCVQRDSYRTADTDDTGRVALAGHGRLPPHDWGSPTTALNHWANFYAGDISPSASDTAPQNRARRPPIPPAELHFEYSVGNAIDPPPTSLPPSLVAHSKAAVVKLIDLLVREIHPGSH
ncbi:hypothetical protein BJ742DRAFT_781268 [Cladochytrium replicatum]|nr:hypothetical protein BJ742DRAFT_781268 [Cladochytrium replicatum]